MRYVALACDFDGTLAREGRVAPETLAALEQVRRSGRRLLLVTGRTLPGLQVSLPDLSPFEHVVAENGALLHHPVRRETVALASPPDPGFVADLRARGVHPLSVGEVIVATWEPFQTVVLDAIRACGQELQVIFNKGAVMVLPSGVNKASGLRAALDDLGLSRRNVVGVGDAENDHAFLALCECGVAVANALPALRERADWVTAAEDGEGVRELIGALLESDLAELEPRLARHRVPLGETLEGETLAVPGYGASVLVAGTSGSGKSTFATGFLERLQDREAQIVVIDPEGDYQQIEGLAALGSAERGPEVDEVLELLARPDRSAAVNLLGVALEDRPELFQTLLLRLHELRTRLGRPHWIVVDEAHYLLPREREPGSPLLPAELQGMLCITVHPDHLSPAVLASSPYVVAIGKAPAHTLAAVAQGLGLQAPAGTPRGDLEPGQALLWQPGRPAPPARFRTLQPRAERRRHVRKYAEGELGADRSFYFRGPEERLNLRAPNLTAFLSLAEGVDEDTWLHHLRRGDYSRWLADTIKDEALASEAREIEREGGSAEETRARMREAISRRYTRPP